MQKDNCNTTPLPLGRIAVLMVVFLSNALAYYSPLPMIPFMVQHFYSLNSESEQARIGYLSGLVAMSFTVGKVIASPFWGALSDRIGRRPVILFSLLGSVAGMLGFGLAQDFETALMARAVTGAFGASAVARSYMADITDETNEARAFGMIGAVWGAAGMLGPAIGGLLAQPARQYPTHFSQDGLFGDARFPFLLPCIVVAVCSAGDLLLALWLLPESRPAALAAATPASSGRHCGCMSDVRSLLATQRALRAPLAVFLVFGVTFIGYQECFPIWAREPNALGGPGWTASRLGMVLGVAALGTFVASIVMYPPLARLYGQPRVFCFGVALNLLAYPIPAVLGTSLAALAARVAVPVLITSNTLNAMGWEFCFTTCNIMVKNAVPPENIGLALALGDTAVTLGQGVGPVPSASLFALSTQATLDGSSSSLPIWLRSGRLFFVLVQLLLLANLWVARRHLDVGSRVQDGCHASAKPLLSSEAAD